MGTHVAGVAKDALMALYQARCSSKKKKRRSIAYSPPGSQIKEKKGGKRTRES